MQCNPKRSLPGRSSPRRMPDGRVRSAAKDGGPDAFRRVFAMVTRAASGQVTSGEAHDNMGDLVRVSARARALEKRLGGKGAVELSPYLESLLRVASESRIVEPARLRQPA